ncbi:hypothetical protein CRYUN_Cryun09bG0028400 [Craigia yunnanensis]
MSITCSYNTESNANKVPIINIGSSSALDNNLELTRKRSVFDIRSHLVNYLPNQCPNVGSNNIDMCSTTNNASAKPAVLKNKSAASSTVRSSHPFSAFQSKKINLSSATQKVVLDKADDQQQPPEHDDLSLKKLAADAPHCGLSNELGGPVEGNAGNCSVNGSVSSSNHGSNGPNGSSTAVNNVGTNIESDNGIAGKSVSGDASGSGSKADQSKSAHRDAALTKFHQKRKERCFQKKETTSRTTISHPSAIHATNSDLQHPSIGRQFM